MSLSNSDIFDFGTIDEKDFISQLQQELSSDDNNSHENLLQSFKVSNANLIIN